VAEEFEHKSVCHDALTAVSGDYLKRMQGLAYSFWHINHCFDRAADIVFKRHRADMNAEERAASMRRHMTLTRRQHAFVLPRVLRLLVPGFDPARLQTPAPIAEALRLYQSRSSMV
jgi:predicted metal-dependent hydrolase